MTAGDASIRSALSTRALVLMPVLAALIVVLGLAGRLAVPGSPVPITLQTLGVMLAADLAGPWIAAGAVGLFWLGTAIGLPLLTGGRGGLANLLGPSGGYLFGWILGALVTGVLAQRFGGRALSETIRLVAANLVGGVLVIHACGIAWLVTVAGMGLGKAWAVDLAFIPGDALKAVLAGLLAVAVFAGYPPARTLTRG